MSALSKTTISDNSGLSAGISVNDILLVRPVGAPDNTSWYYFDGTSIWYEVVYNGSIFSYDMTTLV
jgi:hypothetical protein